MRRWRMLTFVPVKARMSRAISVSSSIGRTGECLVQSIGAQVADHVETLLGHFGPRLGYLNLVNDGFDTIGILDQSGLLDLGHPVGNRLNRPVGGR